MKDPRLENLHPLLCFICQENPTNFHINHNGIKADLCGRCKDLVWQEATRKLDIVRGLLKNDRTHLFQYTLGLRYPTVGLEFTRINTCY